MSGKAQSTVWVKCIQRRLCRRSGLGLAAQHHRPASGKHANAHDKRDHGNVQGYLRVSVLNGCRSALRRARRAPRPAPAPHAVSAEADALSGEEQRAAVAAVRRLPPRQREALVLRYFAGLTEQETAQAMSVSLGTVKSTTARAIAAVGRMLREEQ